MNISFFYSRGSAGYVRGEQMADYLDGKKNPKSGFEDDICIYVKVVPSKSYPKHSYIDVVDAPKAVEWLKTHPDIGVIAISQVAQRYLNKILNRKDVVFIPHHHCNYNRELIPQREVKTVGIMGSQNSFQYPIEEIRKKLKDIGLKLLYDFDHWEKYNNIPTKEFKDSREKVVDYYKKIDIQIVWRPKAWSPQYNLLRSPLKLENTGSFGIPTIAYPEPSYVDEFGDCFLPAKTIDELLELVKKLKSDKEFYSETRLKALVRAENYHIDHIAKLYQNL